MGGDRGDDKDDDDGPDKFFADKRGSSSSKKASPFPLRQAWALTWPSTTRVKPLSST